MKVQAEFNEEMQKRILGNYRKQKFRHLTNWSLGYSRFHR